MNRCPRAFTWWRQAALVAIAALVLVGCAQGITMTHTQARDQLERYFAQLRAAMELHEHPMDGEAFEMMGSCEDDSRGPQRIEQMRSVRQVGERLRSVALDRAVEVLEEEGFEVDYGVGNDDFEASVFAKRDGFSLQVQVVPGLRRVNLLGATPCVDVPDDDLIISRTPDPLPTWSGDADVA